ncbi:hypothetical protein [Embleya hyalina]|uniref:Secreted protein n=1 Tax=Embleya hyalina TaxID=516124 RepID=A0A401Z5Z2_9ACTN|nr:hypothetical protein [Embleya hyalina]GCE02263.1 hypothetical protein EHYA_10040 [Embleya hyalina]
MRFLRRIVATGALAAAGAAALFALATPTAAPAASAPSTGAVADDQPGYAVENFAYPGADKIKTEKGILLKRGDGHILLTGCAAGTGQLEVWARGKGQFCFRVIGDSGLLTLEVPSVYAVKGAAAQSADVTLTAADSTRQDIEVGKDTWTPVGESADPQSREFALLEIRTSK